METLEERRLLSAPAVTGPADRFQWNVGPQTIDFTFDQNALINDPAIQLTNLTTGADGTGWLTRTSADNTAALDYRVDHTDQSGISHSLDRGNYDLYLNASQVSNDAGEPMAADDLSSFFFQPGDINHDRTVNQTDYNTMSNNVPTFGATYSQGDVNYDGYVGDDEDALIAWYGTTLKPAPDAPNTLTASGGPALIDLDWAAPDDPTGIDYYGIWRSSDGGETFSFLTDTDGPVTSYRDSGLPDGSKFMYQVRAHTPSGGYSLATNKAWAVTTLPGPTTAPIVSNIKAHGLTLTWDDNSAGEGGFLIIATDPDGAQTMIDAPAHDGTGQQSFDVTGLSPSTAYTFQVQAYTDGQVSAYSPSASATTADPSIPDTPTNLTATGGLGEVQLNWTPPANRTDLDEYQIERSADGGETFELYDSIYDDTATTWTDSDVSDGTSYTYRLTAVSWEAGVSTPSAPVNATTAMPAPADAPVISLLGSTGLTATWDDTTTDETGFDVQILNVATQQASTISVPAHTDTGHQSYTISSLEPATEYLISVRAKTDVQQSDWSPSADAVTLGEGIPNPASNLTASSGDWHSVQLSWQDNSDDETGFTIQQLDANGVWQTIGTVAANVTGYTVSSGITSSTDYDFRVLADGTGGSSGAGDFGGGGSSGDGGGGSGDDGSQDDGSGTDDGPGGSDNYASVTSQEAFGDVFLRDGGVDDVWQPISRQWEGGETFDDGDPIGIDHTPETLQLNGLPAHGALIITGVYDYSDNPNADWKVDVDGAPMDIGQLTTGVWVPHTSSTVTIEITPLRDNDGYWTVPDLRVQMDTPNLSIGSTTLAVGDEADVRIGAGDHGLFTGQVQAWPDDLTPIIDNSKAGAVTTEGSPIIAGGTGSASLTLQGVEAGVAAMALKIADMGAASQPATETAIKIVNAVPQPSAQLNGLIQKLGSDKYSDREAAATELAELLAQYPGIGATLSAARGKTANLDIRAGIDNLLANQLLMLTLQGGTLTYAKGPGAGADPGTLAGGTVSMTSSDTNIVDFKTANGQVAVALAQNKGPGDSTSGTGTLHPEQSGTATITVTLRMTFTDAAGHTIQGNWAGSIRVKVVKVP